LRYIKIIVEKYITLIKIKHIKTSLKKSHLPFLFFIGLWTYGQDVDRSAGFSTFFSSEIILGKTFPSNSNFPETTLQKGIFIGLGRHHRTNEREWAVQLNHPKTGILFGVTDFGNAQNLGRAYTIMPFLELGLFQKKSTRWSLLTGMGASYVDKQFNAETNPFNKAVSTEFNWSFRSFLYYDFIKANTMDWRFGMGYIHHSNGHVRLPNQGFNSVAASISTNIYTNSDFSRTDEIQLSQKERTSESYFSFRGGLGQNVLSRIFNDKKEVYSVAFSTGKIINKTFKFGVGFYYRFYEQYYDYIKNNEQLVVELYPFFRDNPYRYATNFGLSAEVELLLGHVGVEMNLGLNLHKPFYKLDWQLNDGYTTTVNGETVIILGELDSYYKIKRTVSSRLGLKYYLINTVKNPKNNIFLGVHLNANLGQADFSELSLGYVYRFN